LSDEIPRISPDLYSVADPRNNTYLKTIFYVFGFQLSVPVSETNSSGTKVISGVSDPAFGKACQLNSHTFFPITSVASDEIHGELCVWNDIVNLEVLA
jgi:hypothetical protein